jgi:hypothetical protein
MNYAAAELLKLARELIASVPFKDIPVGSYFHTGTGKGMGYESDTVQITVFQKTDSQKAEVVKADWAPRQIGRVDRFSPFSPVFTLGSLPTHDTRKGL